MATFLFRNAGSLPTPAICALGTAVVARIVYVFSSASGTSSTGCGWTWNKQEHQLSGCADQKTPEDVNHAQEKETKTRHSCEGPQPFCRNITTTSRGQVEITTEPPARSFVSSHPRSIRNTTHHDVAASTAECGSERVSLSDHEELHEDRETRTTRTGNENQQAGSQRGEETTLVDKIVRFCDAARGSGAEAPTTSCSQRGPPAQPVVTGVLEYDGKIRSSSTPRDSVNGKEQVDEETQPYFLKINHPHDPICHAKDEATSVFVMQKVNGDSSFSRNSKPSGGTATSSSCIAEHQHGQPTRPTRTPSTSHLHRKHFWCDEATASGYDASTAWAHRRVAKGHVHLVRKFAHGHVLEVAGGTGKWLGYYADEQCDNKITAITLVDSSKEMLRRAYMRAVQLQAFAVGVGKPKRTDKESEDGGLGQEQARKTNITSAPRIASRSSSSKNGSCGASTDPHHASKSDTSKIHLKLQTADAEHLPHAWTDRFDTVVDVLGLCSYDNPEKAVQEMFRVLKPETGRLILSEHGIADYKLVQYAQEKFWEKNFHECGCDSTIDMFGLVRKALGRGVVEVGEEIVTSTSTPSCRGLADDSTISEDFTKVGPTGDVEQKGADRQLQDTEPQQENKEKIILIANYEIVYQERRSLGAYYHLVIKKKT
ncbi:unnamed protein product [Amoebophrya sp. A120]|nr:unnamed protein product [Amoebophrya sp. A120]|eukprot:GSA120T00006811001.1